MKQRRIHRWLGLIAVVGLTISCITGIALNYPDQIKDDGSIHQAIGNSHGIYYLYDRHISFDDGKVETRLPTRHPIRYGDQLIAYSTGIAILHRDQVLMTYENGLWTRLNLPESMAWITHVSAIDREWVITTSTGVWKSTGSGETWTMIRGPYPESLRDTIKRFHTGWQFGPWGQTFMTASAILTLGLIVTGIALLIKRKRRKL
ncbi:hypothetical protein EBR57_00350 [bacterium]|nr:hypothetical protein [bacterium]